MDRTLQVLPRAAETAARERFVQNARYPTPGGRRTEDATARLLRWHRQLLKPPLEQVGAPDYFSLGDRHSHSPASRCRSSC